MKTFKDLKIGDEIYIINSYLKGVCCFTIDDIKQSNIDIEYILCNECVVDMTVNDIDKDSFNDMVFINEEDAIQTYKMYINTLNWFKINNI